jgi:hypothetical protein
MHGSAGSVLPSNKRAYYHAYCIDSNTGATHAWHADGFCGKRAG